MEQEELSSSKKTWKRLVSSIQTKVKLLHCSKALTKTNNNHNHRDHRLPRPSRHVSHPHHLHHRRYQNVDEKQQAQMSAKTVNNIDKKAIEAAVSKNEFTASELNCLNNAMVTRPERRVAAAAAANDDDDDDEKVVVVVDSSVESAFTELRLNEVDARAEEFIRRNKEAWRLEKQRSAEEYFAMLARGT